MHVSYDGTAARGRQWTITKDDGTVLRGVSQATALAALMGDGRSIRESAIIVAAAKLAAAAA